MNFPIEIRQKYMEIAAAIGFNPADVKERFTAGHGPGGQKINKSQNCVELTHMPTGIEVRYQHHRGLHRNRKEAWELLILKVEEKLRGDASQFAQSRHKIEKQKQRRSRRAKEKMLEKKRHQAEIKEFRKSPSDNYDL